MNRAVIVRVLQREAIYKSYGSSRLLTAWDSWTLPMGVLIVKNIYDLKILNRLHKYLECSGNMGFLS